MALGAWDPMQTFDVGVRRTDGAVTLHLEGEIDESAARQIGRWVRDLLEDRGNLNVAVDVDEVVGAIDLLEEELAEVIGR